MASTYTPLGIELQATGENAGTWGTKTNTNLQIFEQVSGGYTTQAVSDSGDTTLSVSDGSTGATLAHRVIEFTGALTAGRNVTIPLDVQNFYIMKNSTTGGFAVTFKYVSGAGTTVSIANGKTVIVYAKADDGTNPNISSVNVGGIAAVVDDTSPQLGGDLDMNGQDIVTTANANIDLNPNGTGVVNLVGNATRAGTLRFTEDTDDGSNYLDLKAGAMGSNLAFTLPTADGSSGQAITTNGSGALSFSDAGISTGKAIAMALIFG